MIFLAQHFLSLRQGSRVLEHYSVEFRTIAADSRWNDESFRGAFLSRHNGSIKDKLVVRYDSKCLDTTTTR